MQKIDYKFWENQRVPTVTNTSSILITNPSHDIGQLKVETDGMSSAEETNDDVKELFDANSSEESSEEEESGEEDTEKEEGGGEEGVKHAKKKKKKRKRCVLNFCCLD